MVRFNLWRKFQQGFLSLLFFLLRKHNKEELKGWKRSIFLLQIIEEILLQQDLSHLLQKIVSLGVRFLQVDAGTLRLADSERKFLLLKAAVGTSRSSDCISLPVDRNSIAGQSFIKGVPFLCPDISREPLYPWNNQEVKKFTSLLTVPLKTKDEILGVLSFYCRRKKYFSSFELKIAQLFASQAALAIVNKSYIDKISKLAITERLTGLYNQGYFYQRLKEELSRASRWKLPLSILFIDVDGMKNINDTYGHLKGDEILQLVAGGIKNSIREMDIAFRYGGDEFAVILPQTSSKQAFIVAERIKEQAKIKAHPYNITLSIGLVSFPEDGDDPRNLLNKADKAMYRVKQEGGDGVRKFS